MKTKLMYQKKYNPKRVLMTGPVKVNESPHRVSNKKEYLSKNQLMQYQSEVESRLSHAHNLIVKKQLNEHYFKVNKDVSKEDVFKITKEDFDIKSWFEIAKEEATQKFLKKYYRDKRRKKHERERVRKMKERNMKALELHNDSLDTHDGSAPRLKNNLTSTNQRINKMLSKYGTSPSHMSVNNSKIYLQNRNLNGQSVTKKNIDLGLIDTMTPIREGNTSVFLGKTKDSAINIGPKQREFQNSVKDTIDSHAKRSTAK